MQIYKTSKNSKICSHWHLSEATAIFNDDRGP